MKKLKLSFLAASALFWGMGCSSSNTDTANTASTAENVAATDTAATAASDMATGATTTQPLDTTSFPVMAASSDMFEVLSSTEAQNKATSPDVKAYAQHMITDHTKTSTEMKALASKKNLLLPAAPIPMHQRMITALSTEDADDFDKAYMTAQVLAHRQAVSLYETASNSTTLDPELKAFATKTLPALRMHLDMAQKSRDKVK